jgi:uncharacterized membrane protein YjgN (DUF898 family)
MMTAATGENARAFEFTGTWRDYAPIAFTNLLLSIVTLGIYTFWARARTRRYLWGHTRFIDDRLEWTGTGKELFVGYLLAFLVVLLPLGIVNFVVQGVLMRGHPGAAATMTTVLTGMGFYLLGVARFRALRYRLSRTRWHGIRGGSDRQGFAYGVGYMIATTVSAMTFYLMLPWSMVRMWNERWSAMSFGSLRFHSDANWRPPFRRFALFYLTPIVLFAILVVVGISYGASGGFSSSSNDLPIGPIMAGLFVFMTIFFVFFGGMGFIAAGFYAAFFREGIGKLTLGDLQFGFDARTKDWVKFFLGTAALVIFTLGIGLIFVSYRNWAFLMRHLNAYGEVAVDTLMQSQTRDPGQGEGLLDAFDVGAF